MYFKCRTIIATILIVLTICHYAYSEGALSRNKVTDKEFGYAERSLIEGKSLTEPSKEGVSGTAMFFTLQIPIPVSAFNLKDGKWVIAPQIGAGASFVFMVANVNENNEGNFNVTPLFFIGPMIAYGANMQPDQPQSVGSLPIGAVAGFSIISVGVGYDVLQNCLSISVGTKIDSFVFSDALSTNILNFKKKDTV